jgi:hypothetical protein
MKHLKGLAEICGVDGDLFYRTASGSVQFDGLFHVHKI